MTNFYRSMKGLYMSRLLTDGDLPMDPESPGFVLEGWIDTAPFEDLLQLAHQGDSIAIRALEQMANYLGRGAAMLVSGLSPDLLVFVGDVTRVWNRVEPILAKVVNQRASTHPSVKLIPCDSATQPRVRGIIALVLQKHFVAPTIA